MRRGGILGVLLALSLLVSASLAPRAGVAAQDAAGVAVPIVNDEGTTVGSIAVNEVIDPFTAFNPDYPPEAGSRFVVANVAFDADAGERFDILPWTVVLQDADGFLWNQASLILPEDALIPLLAGQTLAPGSRVTGLVGFLVPEGSEPARILYQPVSNQFLVLADLIDAPAPALGQAVEIPDSMGGTGIVSVAEIVDPFEGFDPTYPPPAGTRFVLVTLTYENPGEGRFFVEPFGLLLRDANGTLWSPTSIFRPAEEILIPDMRSGQLAPGDRISGVVGFAVPEGIDLVGLYLSPVSQQLLQLADFQNGSDAAPVAQISTPEPVADDSATVSATTSEDPCLALEQWLSATRERIQTARQMSAEDATLANETSLAEHVIAYGQLADEQRATAAPADAAAVNAALAATFNGYSGALERILGADGPGKDETLELSEGMNTFNDAGQRLQEIENELARLAGACGLS
jgi:hypothetical protein